jgi:hypothetical protein
MKYILFLAIALTSHLTAQERVAGIDMELIEKHIVQKALGSLSYQHQKDSLCAYGMEMVRTYKIAEFHYHKKLQTGARIDEEALEFLVREQERIQNFESQKREWLDSLSSVIIQRIKTDELPHIINEFTKTYDYDRMIFFNREDLNRVVDVTSVFVPYLLEKLRN